VNTSAASGVRVASPASLPARLALFASDIKIAHTVFAMPFALLSTFVAAGGWPKAGQFLLIILCMVTARTVAMSANRLLDAGLDARNPRTAGRAIPSGRLPRWFFMALAAACAVAFVLSAGGFYWWYGNVWPVALSVPVLAFLVAYPLLKRFTQLCHYYLGAALGLAPVCAWVAIAGTPAWPPVVMAGAVLLWTAGFDIIYACQDYQSDLETGVISTPTRLGIAKALWVSRLAHVGSAGLLFLLGWLVPQFGSFYLSGAALAAGLLIVEHSLVSANDLSKAGVAFFTVNGIISVVVGALGIVDVLLRGS
jgi:4-hydroxybenzoate polyprenyltransferase